MQKNFQIMVDFSNKTVVITNVSSALTKRDYTCYFALLKKNLNACAEEEEEGRRRYCI